MGSDGPRNIVSYLHLNTSKDDFRRRYLTDKHRGFGWFNARDVRFKGRNKSQSRNSLFVLCETRKSSQLHRGDGTRTRNARTDASVKNVGYTKVDIDKPVLFGVSRRLHHVWH